MNRTVVTTLMGLAVPAVAFLVIAGLEMRERWARRHVPLPEEGTLPIPEMKAIGKP